MKDWLMAFGQAVLTVGLAIVLCALVVFACIVMIGCRPAWAANETDGDPVQVLRQRLGTIMQGSYFTFGCTPSTPPVSSSMLLFLCEGVVYAQKHGVPVSQPPASVTLTGGDGIYWLALHTDRTTTVSGWNRQAGTHYLWIKAATAPALVNSALIGKLTIAGGVITLFEDWRAPSSLVRSGTYDVTDVLYGAVPDDATDLGPSLQLAIRAAVAQSGRVVRIPQGIYKWNTAVTVANANGITIQGDGWAAPAQQLFTTNAQPRRGTWLHISGTGFTPLTITATGTTIKDLAFDQDHPVPAVGWTPTNYPYVIDVVTPSTCCDPQTNLGDVNLDNLFFFKVNQGIRQVSVAGWVGGRININGLWGQFFRSGIFYEYVADVSRLTNIHIWPYWSQDVNVLTYQESTMLGISLWRADALMLSNYFVFSAYVGIEFLTNAFGPSQVFQGSNIICDKSRVCVFSDQNGTTGQIVNLTHNSGGLIAAMLPTSIGVSLTGTSSSLEIVNLEVSNVGDGCASVLGNGSQLTVVNLRCSNFNLAGSGHAGLLTSGGGAIMVGGLTRFAIANGAPSYSGTFLSSNHPNGALFNQAGTFFANELAGIPTLGFGANDFLQWLPSTDQVKLGASAGTYNTGGVKKYLCVQDGVLTPGTTCP